MKEMKTSKRKRCILNKYLAKRVLAVAVVDYEDSQLIDWTVYIDSVEGLNHSLDSDLVYWYGEKQSKELAHTLFPMDITKYRV